MVTTNQPFARPTAIAKDTKAEKDENENVVLYVYWSSCIQAGLENQNEQRKINIQRSSAHSEVERGYHETNNYFSSIAFSR